MKKSFFAYGIVFWHTDSTKVCENLCIGTLIFIAYATFKFQVKFRDLKAFKVEMRKLEIGGFSGFTRSDSRNTLRYEYFGKRRSSLKK